MSLTAADEPLSFTRDPLFTNVAVLPPFSDDIRDTLTRKVPMVQKIALRYNKIRNSEEDAKATQSQYKQFQPIMQAVLLCMSEDDLQYLVHEEVVAETVCDTADIFTFMGVGPLYPAMHRPSGYEFEYTHPPITAAKAPREVPCAITGETGDVWHMSIVTNCVGINNAWHRALELVMKHRDIPGLLFGAPFAAWLASDALSRHLCGCDPSGQAWNLMPLTRALRAHFAAGRLGCRPLAITGGGQWRVHFSAHWLRAALRTAAAAAACREPTERSVADLLPGTPDVLADLMSFGRCRSRVREGAPCCSVRADSYEDARRLFAMLALRWTAAVAACLSGTPQPGVAAPRPVVDRDDVPRVPRTGIVSLADLLNSSAPRGGAATAPLTYPGGLEWVPQDGPEVYSELRSESSEEESMSAGEELTEEQGYREHGVGLP